MKINEKLSVLFLLEKSKTSKDGKEISDYTITIHYLLSFVHRNNIDWIGLGLVPSFAGQQFSRVRPDSYDHRFYGIS